MARFSTEIRLGPEGGQVTFPVELQDVTSRIESAVVVHEIPGRNGAKLQHHGLLAQVLSLRAYWLQRRYDQHFAFREALKQTGLCEFVHPEYGPLTGMIRSASFRHDDRLETAEADIEFVEEAAQVETSVRINISDAAETAFQKSQAEQIEAFKVAVRGELGAEAGSILSKELDPGSPVLGQFTGLSAKARSYLRIIDSGIAVFKGALLDIENPANSLVGTLNYGLTLPDQVIGGLTRTCERYSLALSTLRSFPDRFLLNLHASLQQLVAAIPGLDKPARAAAASRLGLDGAGLYAEDEERRDAWRKTEQQPAFDVSGRYRAPTAALEPIMNAREVENSLAFIRENLQQVFSADRTQTALCQLGLDLLNHVRNVKIEYDRIVEIVVDHPTPFHMVLRKAGLPISYGERVLALNPQITHPNFVQGRVKVYAR